MNISKEELDNLEKIGSGNFGTIYRYDNQILKVYNDLVKCNGYDLVRNPMLKHKNSTIKKCNRLINRGKRIQNTDLITDILFLDNIFSGVVMPYYDGQLFLELRKKPLSERIEPAKKLVINANELTNNRIYPLDYKLINIILVDKEAKIIDLDDVLTKVLLFKSSYYNKESIYGLDETIKSFFNELSVRDYSDDFYSHITRKKEPWNGSYKEINDYINRKSIENRLLFTDGQIDNEKDRLIDDSRIILVYDKYNHDELISIINKLRARGIFVYDLVSKNNINKYINDNCTSECLGLEQNKVLRLK